uniref:V-set domain containing T cell activation inhibitor 1 n=1 Tax=Mastacembelus armatus TaxID=205130 RepID=A0A3Q3N2Q9_9TELE
MATLGQIIFYTMVTLIFVVAALIILILALAFSNASSEVMSSNTTPIANLGGDELLSCYLNTANPQTSVRQLSVIWEKKDTKGLVYKYVNGAPDLTGQDSQFKERTQLFSTGLPTGNASLLLRNVKSTDEGEYTCTIVSSDGGGKVNIHLRTAAFTAPTFTLSNGTLGAEASRWFPKPNVMWSDFDGKVLQGSTILTENSAGIFSVASTLHPVNTSATYSCTIGNDLVTAVSKVTTTGKPVFFLHLLPVFTSCGLAC